MGRGQSLCEEPELLVRFSLGFDPSSYLCEVGQGHDMEPQFTHLLNECINNTYIMGFVRI